MEWRVPWFGPMGWGGSLVGLSSIDDLDASGNQTATIREFKEKT